MRNELYEQLVSYIDLILDGRKCHLESVKGTEKFEVLLKQYETDRMNLIQPLSRRFLVKSCNQLDKSGYLYQIIYSKGRTVRQRCDVSREVLRFCVPYTDMRID